MLEVEDVIKFYRKIFRIYGFWRIPPISKLHSCLSVLGFLFGVLVPLILVTLSVFHANTVEELTLSMAIDFSYIVVVILIVMNCVRRGEIEKLAKKLGRVFHEDPEGVAFGAKASSTALKFSKFSLLATLLSVKAVGIPVVLIYRFFPIPLWMPESLSDSTICFVLYVLIFCMTLVYGVSCISLLLFALSLLIIINGYGKFLRYKLKMLVSTRHFCGRKDLIQCMLIHQKFLSLIDEFKSCFGFQLGMFYKDTILCFGGFLFCITQDEGHLTSQERFMFHFFLFIPVLNMLICSYFGDAISSTSECFLDDLYSSDWTEADRSYKKSMIIFMENLKEPIKLSVLFYDEINLRVFYETCDEGYSLYQVFVNLKKLKA